MSRRSLDDLLIWKAAREIGSDVYRHTRNGRFEDPSLRHELRTAAREVMMAVAAAYEAQSAPGLARGFDRAGVAITNLASLLHLTVDLELFDEAASAGLLARTRELGDLVRQWQRAIRAHRRARSLTASRLN